MKSGTVTSEWDSVAQALDQKKTALEEAKITESVAKNELEKLSHPVEDGRENPGTRTNPVFIQARDKLNR